MDNLLVRRSLMLDVGVFCMVFAITWPMWLSSGYGLARDMVFVPRHVFTAEALGLGSSPARAVPLDGVLAVLTTVVDGGVIFRLAVAGVLLSAGWGAHRFDRRQPLAARAVMAVAAIWNPYVLERLAMGQWALLFGYSAMWWLIPWLNQHVRTGSGRWSFLLAWITLGSLTPTGGVLLLLIAVAVALMSATDGPHQRRRGAAVVGVLALWQLPWILPSLFGLSATVSDPLGVDVFAVDGERPGGVLTSVIATGGIWNHYVVPASSGTWWGVLLPAGAVAALFLGVRSMKREQAGLVLASCVAIVIALVAHVPGGTELLKWTVESVPGAGLLRDAHKWLAPYVVLLVACMGVATARVMSRVQGREAATTLVAVVAVGMPVFTVPDGAVPSWRALQPVRYPADLVEAAELLKSTSDTGGVVTLPWASYRQFPWGNQMSASDPLQRWVDSEVVVNDDLVVPDGVVQGESARSSAVEPALSAAAGEVPGRLAELGVGWVLVYEGADGGSMPDRLDDQLALRVDGTNVKLYRNTRQVAAQEDVVGWQHASAVAVNLTWMAVGMSAAGWLTFISLRRRRRVRSASL